MLKQIDEYETNTIEAMQIDQKAKEEFEKKISELDAFSKTWKSYLKKVKIEVFRFHQMLPKFY